MINWTRMRADEKGHGKNRRNIRGGRPPEGGERAEGHYRAESVILAIRSSVLPDPAADSNPRSQWQPHSRPSKQEEA